MVDSVGTVRYHPTMPRKPPKTVAGLYGTDAADDLARLALDLLTCRSSERAQAVRQGRAVAERHGIHWKAIRAYRKLHPEAP